MTPEKLVLIPYNDEGTVPVIQGVDPEHALFVLVSLTTSKEKPVPCRDPEEVDGVKRFERLPQGSVLLYYGDTERLRRRLHFLVDQIINTTLEDGRSHGAYDRGSNWIPDIENVTSDETSKLE